MKKRLNRVLCAALCVFLLTGCDRGGESLGELVVSSQPVSEQERSAFPAQVCGVELRAAAERAVSLSPAVTEIICELGFKDKLCGVSSYCDYPEGLTATALGSTENPDIDGIRALSPDVVFTLSALSERDTYELTSVGIAVIPLTAPRTLAEYAALYSDIARAFYGAELSADDEKQGEICAQLDDYTMPEAIIFLGSVPIAPYDTPGSVGVADSIIPFLAHHDTILMENHGALTVGVDITQAYYRMETLEHFAKVSLVARQLGGAHDLPMDKIQECCDIAKSFPIRHPGYRKYSK